VSRGRRRTPFVHLVPPDSGSRKWRSRLAAVAGSARGEGGGGRLWLVERETQRATLLTDRDATRAVLTRR